MIFRALHKKAEGKPSHLALMMAKTLISIAREWVKAPPEQIAELKRLRSKLPDPSGGPQQEEQAASGALDGPGCIDALLDLPAVLMTQALSDRCAGKRRLPLVQVAW